MLKQSDSLVTSAGGSGSRVSAVPAAHERGLELYRSELAQLGVDPDQEGQGFGTTLMGSVARELLGRGLVPMMVWTWEGSERAQHFYIDHLGAEGPLLRKVVPCPPAPGEYGQTAFGWPNSDVLLDRCRRDPAEA